LFYLERISKLAFIVLASSRHTDSEHFAGGWKTTCIVRVPSVNQQFQIRLTRATRSKTVKSPANWPFVIGGVMLY
jgi:hypothetical protein